MGLFGRSKNSKERKEARKMLKHFEKSRTAKLSATSDPSKAIHELQPWEVNQEKPRQGLSALVHKDVWGREIAEPDLTNPTRSRWERPLDTIRSFQEAVDRGYRRSYYGAEDLPPVSSPSSQAGRSVRNDYQRNGGGGGGGGYYDHPQIPNRMGGSGTPMTNNSHEELATFGTMSGRVALNDSMMVGGTAMPGRNQTRGHSGGSGNGGYADTGYGESVNQPSRGGSAGNPDSAAGVPWKDNDNFWGPTNGNAYPISLGGAPNQGGNPYSPVGQVSNPPPQQQQYAPQPPAARPIIKMSPSKPPPPEVENKKTRKSWLGKRLSKKVDAH